MKHIIKLMATVVVISAIWIALLQTSVLPSHYAWLLPIYFVVSLGCYGLLMVGIGLMNFPTCPEEALLLQQLTLPCHCWGVYCVVPAFNPICISLCSSLAPNIPKSY